MTWDNKRFLISKLSNLGLAAISTLVAALIGKGGL